MFPPCKLPFRFCDQSLIFFQCRHKISAPSSSSTCFCCCPKSNDIRKSQSFYAGLSQQQGGAGPGAGGAGGSSAGGLLGVPASGTLISGTAFKGGQPHAANNGTLFSMNTSMRVSLYLVTLMHSVPASVIAHDHCCITIDKCTWIELVQSGS